MLLFFWLTVLPGLSAAQSSELIHYLGTLERLQVSIIVEDKDGLVIFEHNAHKVVPSASVIKIPILVELMVQAQALEINLEDEYLLKEEDIVGGSGELQHLTPGHELTIKELAVEMIRVSDNTATNVLINKLGFDRINQLLEANGFTNTQLERLMMDFDAIKQGKQNYTSASEMNRLLRMILTSEILKPEFSQKALEILLKCEDSSTIPSQLPAGVRVAWTSPPSRGLPPRSPRCPSRAWRSPSS